MKSSEYIKASILYFSKTGNTKSVAETIKKGLEKVDGTEVKMMPLDNLDYSFIDESQIVVFGSPTYYANISWQIKKFFDESWKCNLEGKLGAVYATADFVGGGADTALLTLINHLMVKGMLVYSGGSALGRPYIHLGLVTIKKGNEEQKQVAIKFGERLAVKAVQIFTTN